MQARAPIGRPIAALVSVGRHRWGEARQLILTRKAAEGAGPQGVNAD